LFYLVCIVVQFRNHYSVNHPDICTSVTAETGVHVHIAIDTYTGDSNDDVVSASVSAAASASVLFRLTEFRRTARAFFQMEYERVTQEQQQQQ
jgi:hypothetical protein